MSRFELYYQSINENFIEKKKKKKNQASFNHCNINFEDYCNALTALCICIIEPCVLTEALIRRQTARFLK